MKVKKMKKSPKLSGNVKKKKKNLSKVTTEEFFEQNFADTESEHDNEETADVQNKENGAEEDSDSAGSDMDPIAHKKSLMKLKSTDPEFYSYLQQNDKKLLDFNLSDDEDDESIQESDSRHIPNPDLEVASDESDYEPEEGQDAVRSKKHVTLKLLKTWQEEIQTDKSSKTIKSVIEAFHAAVQTVVQSPEINNLRFKVEGSAVFNGVVQLCILQLPSALKRFLKIGSDQSHFDAHKLKRFPKIKGSLKSYLKDLITILQNVTSSDILTVLLKHLHQMLSYTKSFSSLTKPLLKVLLKLWSSGEETVRVVAFLNILRIATNHAESVLELLLKAMYVKYVENSKFVSPTTLPGINFMKHSLVEIYLLDDNSAYTHAFLYIRQLAIHLRNAMTLKTKEMFQAVYNWQYMNSLRFWTELITKSKEQSMLRALLYPLIQIIIGTIKVIPTPQYYPLRFHCVQMLTNISKETDTFIPILPFLLEILDSYDFDKKHKTVSMKPVSFICILRMSKSQLQENGFKDSIIENIYQLLLENAANDSHKVYFPDLYVPTIIQLKSFLKKCHIANYCRKMKQLLEKIEENRKYIEKERSKTPLDLKNMKEIINWERKMKNQETSLAKFYASWIKIHQSQKLKALTNNEAIADYRMPLINKSKKQKLDEDSEDDDESDFELRIKGQDEQPTKTSSKKKKKNKSKSQPEKKKMKVHDNDDLSTGDATDIVRDIDSTDWD